MLTNGSCASLAHAPSLTPCETGDKNKNNIDNKGREIIRSCYSVITEKEIGTWFWLDWLSALKSNIRRSKLFWKFVGFVWLHAMFLLATVVLQVCTLIRENNCKFLKHGQWRIFRSVNFEKFLKKRLVEVKENGGKRKRRELVKCSRSRFVKVERERSRRNTCRCQGELQKN